MTCINKPRYSEIVDTLAKPYLLVASKLDVDLVRLDIRDRVSQGTLARIDMTIPESMGLRAALNNCEVVPPLPSLDYPAATDDGVVMLTRTPHERGTPLAVQEEPSEPPISPV